MDLNVLLEALLLPLLEGGRRALEYRLEEAVQALREEVVPLPARARRQKGHEEGREARRELHASKGRSCRSEGGGRVLRLTGGVSEGAQEIQGPRPRARRRGKGGRECMEMNGVPISSIIEDLLGRRT